MTGDLTDVVVHISISVDEWRELAQWMYVSLDDTEHSVYGHFLLECRGTERTWVTTDTAQMTVLHTTGPVPRGLDDPTAPFQVNVNPRLFWNLPPQDAILTVRRTADERLLVLATDGIRSTMPEHPGERIDWRPIVDGLRGAVVDVDTAHLRDACRAAQAIPIGDEAPSTVGVNIRVADGAVRFVTVWSGFPDTNIEVPASPSSTTGTAFVDGARFSSILQQIELPTTQLTVPTDGSGAIGVRAGDYVGLLHTLDPLGGERRHLEALLCEFLSVDHVETDDDGDYPITTSEGHRLWVRLVDAEPVGVQVFSVLATHVDPEPGLFEQINSINASAPYVKVIWASRAVMAEVDLVAGALDVAELANALGVVRHTAERYEVVLSAYFSGSGNASDGGDR